LAVCNNEFIPGRACNGLENRREAKYFKITTLTFRSQVTSVRPLSVPLSAKIRVTVMVRLKFSVHFYRLAFLEIRVP